MKRLVVAAVAAVVLVLLVSGLAFADGGPHGGYTATTDACAGCHRAHTAAAAKLLIDTEENLCTTCHGRANAGADTNVMDGVYDGLHDDPAPGIDGVVDRGLKGGGFDLTLMNTSFAMTAPGTGLGFTSRHTYNGSAETAWGSGALGTPGAGTTIDLSCASCHDPHGNGNYRILRPIPTESEATTGVDVDDETVRNYTIADSTGVYFGEGYDPAAPKDDPIGDQYKQLSPWCAQCHTRYMAGPGSATTDSQDDIFAYRHSTDGVGGCGKCHGAGPHSSDNVEVTFGDGFQHDVQCMTCHVAHGTSALVGGPAASVPYPDDSIVGGNERSSLLRVDGRGTCQACHNKP